MLSVFALSSEPGQEEKVGSWKGLRILELTQKEGALSYPNILSGYWVALAKPQPIDVHFLDYKKKKKY